MGPQEPAKVNAQLIRQNDTFSRYMKLVYCLTRKTCSSLVQKSCMFLQKETSYCKSSFAFGPQGSKHYIFDHFYLKNARKHVRLHIFLLFHARKHVVSSFYLKWTGLTRYCKFCSNCESLRIQTNLVKIHNILWIRSTLGKIMIWYIFYHNNGEINEISAFWYFLSKSDHQKYSAWVPGDPFYAYQG